MDITFDSETWKKPDGGDLIIQTDLVLRFEFGRIEFVMEIRQGKTSIIDAVVYMDPRN
jgi:hypothetical protein